MAAANAEEEDVYLSVLLKAFHDLGYVEGKNIILEHRFPAENLELFRTFARELVAIKPEVIIAVTTLGAIELKKATSTIPIVLVLGSDPIDAGLVDRLDHPGGNVTGLSILSNDLDAKRLGTAMDQAMANLAGDFPLCDIVLHGSASGFQRMGNNAS